MLYFITLWLRNSRNRISIPIERSHNMNVYLLWCRRWYWRDRTSASCVARRCSGASFAANLPSELKVLYSLHHKWYTTWPVGCCFNLTMFLCVCVCRRWCLRDRTSAMFGARRCSGAFLRANLPSELNAVLDPSWVVHNLTLTTCVCVCFQTMMLTGQNVGNVWRKTAFWRRF
jgi:hypothetical protein